MKRAFGNNSGRMGGNGGGGMIRRALGRAVGVSGVQDSVTKTNKSLKNILSLSSTGSTSSTSTVSSSVPVSGSSNTAAPLPTWHSSSFYDSDVWDDWDTVDGGENDDGIVNKVNDINRFVFGPVPSRDEVDDAVSSLQHFLAPASYSQFILDGMSSSSENDSVNPTSFPPGLMHRVPSSGSEMEWMEPSLQLYNSTMVQSHRGQAARVYDAFRMLKNDPSVQRAVVSLSTDKAVWEAVLNNEVVRELRDSYEAEINMPQNSDESPIPGKNVLWWILDNSKAKVMELIEKVTKLLSEVFQPSQMEKDTTIGTTTTTATDMFQETLRSSLLLSVFVLLIVVMTRSQRV
ncbi:hypothetical protein IFM89_030520 [Coptis chinensis]|uniref:Uncharacterized protein n=1 Tax=Coptis chinensis TaxID=261450 RepID=A0A835LRX2_9MAGN|nr:hypothetical protein IFM89_030520 [Coptis chinensis]